MIETRGEEREREKEREGKAQHRLWCFSMDGNSPTDGCGTRDAIVGGGRHVRYGLTFS